MHQFWRKATAIAAYIDGGIGAFGKCRAISKLG
jgi:hypothetical protein